MNNDEKAEILDWMLTPVQRRPDRDPQIFKVIEKNKLQALMTFMAWGTSEQLLEALKKAKDAEKETRP